ncbi:MAG: asparagine synthase-related protein [Paludibacteraceae bacterium]
MIIDLCYKKWYSADNLHVKGYCFDSKSEICENESLCQLFSPVCDEESLLNVLNEANGIFCVLIDKPNFKAIVMDKTRVYPLFFRQEENDFRISDDPYALLNENDVQNPEGVAEYKNLYVTVGNGTLIKDILQAQPLHYTLFSNGKWTQKPYYTYCVKQEEIISIDYDEAFRVALDKTFKRLVQYADGRQLVVPLSGGYDSRLILCMLKECGYENIICYTVGREGSADAINARDVASRLGYEHYFIDNCNPDIVSRYKSEKRFEDYYRFAGSLSGFIFMFEYFALKELTEKGVIGKDAFFVPGHSGDFLGGSQLTKASVKNNFSGRKLVNSVIGIIWSKNEIENSVERKVFFDKIRKTVEQKYEESYLPHSILDAVVMEIKLTRFINNAPRIYEFFGYQVLLPFWDNEMLDFFKRLPLEMKLYNRFYNQYLSDYLFKKYDVDITHRRLQANNFRINLQIVKNKIKRLLPERMINALASGEDSVGYDEMTKPLKEELLLKNKQLRDDELKGNVTLMYWYLQHINEITSSNKEKN